MTMAKRRANKKNALAKDAATVEQPKPSDVLFGRGGHVNHNPANQRYLELVCARKEEYLNCKKTDKADIAWEIIRELKQQDPPARFLKKDCSSNLWHIVEDADVRRKISQCLRERAIPVCPKSKRSKQAKASMPKLRLSLRASQRVEVSEEESADKADSEDELWQPADEAANSSFSGGRVTRRGKQLQAAQEQQSAETAENVASMGWTAPLSSMNETYVAFSQPTKGFPAEPVTLEGAPPPLPAPAPIRLEGSNRVWSDFLTRSFASFAPSIFDFSSGVENAWENLLDASLLPQLAREDDESHYGSCTSEEQVVECHAVGKRSYSQSNRTKPVDLVDVVPSLQEPSDVFSLSV